MTGRPGSRPRRSAWFGVYVKCIFSCACCHEVGFCSYLDRYCFLIASVLGIFDIEAESLSWSDCLVGVARKGSK